MIESIKYDRHIIELVQLSLFDKGLYLGSIDGIWGPKTEKAYQDYVHLDGNNNKSLRELIVSIAEKEIGTKESGTNTGTRVEEYQAATWIDTKGFAWCAAFVCWCILQASKKRELPFKRPQTASAFDFERWAEQNKLTLIKPAVINPERGDIVVYKFSHIGIVTKYANGFVYTVEGNTNDIGSREGDGVYAKVRKLSDLRSIIRL